MFNWVLNKSLKANQHSALNLSVNVDFKGELSGLMT